MILATTDHTELLFSQYKPTAQVCCDRDVVKWDSEILTIQTRTMGLYYNRDVVK